MYRSLLFVLAALVAVVIAGCAAPAVGSPATPASAAATPNTAASPVATPDIAASPVATPGTGASSGLNQDLANQALAWLAKEANVQATDLRVVKAEHVEWTDSCFGLGGPAESCLQAITPGWSIVFEAAGKQYEVRTDQSGTSFRLAPQAS